MRLQHLLHEVLTETALAQPIMSSLLQTQALRVRQANEPCIRLIQENSIEFLLQSSLPYIPFGDGPY